MFNFCYITLFLSKDIESLILSLDRHGLSQRIKDQNAMLESMTPGSDDFIELSDELYFMLNLQKEEMLWDMSEGKVLDSTSFIPPNIYDVILSDVNHELLLGRRHF